MGWFRKKRRGTCDCDFEYKLEENNPWEKMYYRLFEKYLELIDKHASIWEELWQYKYREIEKKEWLKKEK